MKLEQEAYLEWESHPITQKIWELLDRQKVEIKESFRQCLRDSPYETQLLHALNEGNLQRVEWFQNIKQELIDHEYLEEDKDDRTGR